MIVVVVGLAAGATSAYFSDTAEVAGNTFSMGVLEIRANGQETLPAENFGPAAPGDMYTSDAYHVSNYGAPHFGGPSNLPAKSLMVSAENPAGAHLWPYVRARVEVSRVWPITDPNQWKEAHHGKLRDVSGIDLLGPVGLSQLDAGNSIVVRYKVWYPETDGDQSDHMGKSLNWDLVFEGRTN